MSTPHDYLKRLRSLVARVDAALTTDERADVERLINHDEGGEAMLTLAWVLVEGNRRVSVGTIREIRELADGLIDPAEFPSSLASCAIDDEERSAP
jgi:hypothetical protein